MKMRQTAFEGCLLGHALGDALGAPAEFLTRSEIIKRFGPDGIRTLEPWDGHIRGSYTDDTQMMRATAEAVIEAMTAWGRDAPADLCELTWGRYKEWRTLQDDPRYERRPGKTCLTALRGGVPGDTYDALNDSKGSGGIMRVSPVGLAFEPERAFEVAIDLAALTHGHPSGYLAAGTFADIVSRVVRGEPLPDAVADAREQLVGWDEEAQETLDALDLAVELYISDVHPVEAVARIGQGWVAEEALGIAVHCALSYPEDWMEGTLAAVNITGDSDTTGCLVGALLGASLGRDAIPRAWIALLERQREIEALARTLWELLAH